jgi:surfeit locus 1 family protein
VILCVVSAVVCARLGVWQLSRLHVRQLRNEFGRARLNCPSVALGAAPAVTALARFRRVEVAGVYDYAHEVVLANRSRSGSPGVYVVTPLRLGRGDSAILVNRGWVYSPDAATVDLARWRERDAATVRGFLDRFPEAGSGAARSASHPRAYRWLDRAAVAREVGAPLAPMLLVAQGDTAGMGASRIPARLEPPPLDEGPHWNSAVQWFAFAAVSIAGLVAFLRSAGRTARDEGRRDAGRTARPAAVPDPRSPDD